jgi:phosphoribosylanthranilate isomerase
MLTQIYEISTSDEARSISEIGIDHIGVLVGNGKFPRELSLQTTSRIAINIIPPSKPSLLFLTVDLSLIAEWAVQLNPAIVHLGAAPELLSPDNTAILKSKLPGPLIMRSIPIVGETSIELARSY